MKMTLQMMLVSATVALAGCDEEEAAYARWEPKPIAGKSFRAHVGGLPWIANPEKAPDLAMLKSLMLTFGWGEQLGINDLRWYNIPQPEHRRMKALPYSVWDFFGTAYDGNTSRYLWQWYTEHHPDVPLLLKATDSWFPWLMKDTYDCDIAGFNDWRATYTNFVGFAILNESDGGFGSFVSKKSFTNEAMRAEVDRAFPPAKDYADRVRWLGRAMERERKMHFGCANSDFYSIFSGNCKWGHALAKYGVGILDYECELQVMSGPWRYGMCHTRGAARQYELPFGWYSAHLIIGHTRDGKRVQGEWALPTRSRPKVKEKLGVARSILKRNYFYGYMGGASFLGVEKPDECFFDDRQDPIGKPTKYALDFDEIFRIAETTPRGITCTPVAALTGVYQRFTRSGNNGFGVDAFFCTLVPTFVEDGYKCRDTEKGFNGCLWNSEFGEIVDVLTPDAAQKPGDFAAALKPYKWAFMMGKYDTNDFERVAVADWIRQGGTLVTSVGYVEDATAGDAPLVPTELAGVTFATNVVRSGRELVDAATKRVLAKDLHQKFSKMGRDKLVEALMDYEFHLATPTTAKPLYTDENGNVAAWENAVGKGRVITLASREGLPRHLAERRKYYKEIPLNDWTGIFFEITAGRVTFPIVRELLRKCQRETLPVTVEGDIQWGVNFVQKVGGESRSTVEKVGRESRSTVEKVGRESRSTVDEIYKSENSIANRKIEKSKNPHFLVWLINNKGVTKFQGEDEKINHKFDAKVKITNKLTGKTVEKLVPAGGFGWVEL